MYARVVRNGALRGVKGVKVSREVHEREIVGATYMISRQALLVMVMMKAKINM